MASKLNKRELAVRTFILQVFKKEIDITTTVFRKVVTIYADVRNKDIVEKYGDRIYSSMFANYTFKNHKDYTTKMDLLKKSEYLDYGLTQYAQNHSIITKKLFDNDSVKTEWIIEDMGSQGSPVEINVIISFLFTRERKNLSELLNQVLQITQYTKNEETVASTIIKNALSDSKFKDADLIQSIFDRELSKSDKYVLQSIKRYFQNARAHKSIIAVVRNWLYKETNDDEYLPEEAKDIFIF